MHTLSKKTKQCVHWDKIVCSKHCHFYSVHTVQFFHVNLFPLHATTSLYFFRFIIIMIIFFEYLNNCPLSYNGTELSQSIILITRDLL